MAAPAQLARGLTQSLAESLVDAPPSREPTGAAADQGYEEAPVQPLARSGSVPRQSTAEQNREAYQENQRRLAAEVLQGRAACFTCFLIVLGGSLFVFTFFIYIKGYIVYYDNVVSRNPCDEPLSAWLLVVILAFPIRIVLAIVYRCLRAAGEETHQTPLTKCIHNILHAWHLLGNPLLLLVGYYWLQKTKTCHETNPELYDFAQLFFIYQLIMWVGSIIVFFGATTLTLWLMAQGVFDDSQSRPRPADPGTTDRLETVPFGPELFDNVESGSKEPPQCCICQVPYDSSASIKKTPCGHYFHEECLRDWLEKYAKTCPICRQDLEEAVWRSDDP